MWCLGNISGEGSDNRDYILKFDLIPIVA